MARTKFTFEKRQREIARQQKQKDKAARRAEAKQPKEEAEPMLQAEEGSAAEGNADLPSATEKSGPGEEIPR